MKNKFLLLKIFTVSFLLIFLSGCTPKDTAPPSVSITFPPNNATVSGPVDIIASATDNVGVSRVEFYIDGSKVGEDTQAPYEYSWDTDTLQYNSTHSIKAKAYDSAGNTGESQAVTVTIGDTQAPQITITNPHDGDIVSATVSIQVQVVDKTPSAKNKKVEKAPSGVSRVEFYIDGSKVGEDKEAPYEYSWDTTKVLNGTHTITVAAIDNINNSGSASIAVNVNNLGGTTWQKTYGGNNADQAKSIQQTTDGGYIVAGWTDSFGTGIDAYILKLKSDGSLDWYKTYGGSNDDAAYSIQQTTDGGYIVAGYTNSFDTGIDVYILKLKSDGSLDWYKTYGGSNDDAANSIQQTVDGGYIVAGCTYSFGDVGNVYILKLKSDGTLDWYKTYGGSGHEWANSIQQTVDGGYIVAGWTDSLGAGYDAYILKLKSDGSLDWYKTYGGSGDDFANSIQQVADGEYIVAGQTYPFGADKGDVYVLKLKSDGTLDWQKTYGGSNDDAGDSIQQVADGEYIVAGYTRSFGAGYYDVYVLKLKSDGSLDWYKTYGGSNYDAANSIQQTVDGGYIVAGCTWSFGAGLSDVYVIKMDANGNTEPYPE
ncbi:MAG TPA: Ig-like domain-containing protein [Dictyoglomaceae bacterium]|nr:Ig-like domain-containing protein [Dictyoglomaceae bacterium]HPP15711.1 Ig-like domain-containing protein [Dictyoglomaceae bacterium]